MPFLALFVLLPLIEIALFVLVGGWLGLWPTLGLVVLGAVIGLALVRNQGFAALRDVQRSAQGMGDPARPLAHGALIVLAGFLLLLPGFFTDLLALPLLFPPSRNLILRQLARRVVVVAGAARRDPRWAGARDDIIDGEATEIAQDPASLPRNRPSGWTNPPE